MSASANNLIEKSVKSTRWLYFAGIGLGFPLWVLTLAVFAGWTSMAIQGVTEDIGPVEFQTPTAGQIETVRASGIAFLLIYPAAVFVAHRVTRHPWMVFIVMLTPVLALCHESIYFPIDSNIMRNLWLTYLGVLAGILSVGGVIAAREGRRLS
jgi:energy-converting hydrogenase Eha subunit A